MSVVESMNERTLDKTAKIHSQTLHKTTSFAVLIKVRNDRQQMDRYIHK